MMISISRNGKFCMKFNKNALFIFQKCVCVCSQSFKSPSLAFFALFKGMRFYRHDEKNPHTTR